MGVWAYVSIIISHLLGIRSPVHVDLYITPTELRPAPACAVPRSVWITSCLIGKKTGLNAGELIQIVSTKEIIAFH